MIGKDMPGQLKENDCSRTIAIAQNLNPHFPFPNRIDLSRTVKWCHLWSTKSLWYFVLTPLCSQRSSHVCWYLPKDLRKSSEFAQSRSLRVCWYLPTDLCTSADICPRNFAKLLLFYHIFPHVCCNLPTDLCLSADIGPQIFAHLLIFALSRSLHFCRYLPLDLRASTDIGPQIFAPVLIFAHRSSHVFWYLPTYFCTSDYICP